MLRLCWALARLAPAVTRWLAGLPREAAQALAGTAAHEHAMSNRLLVALAVALPASLLAAWALPQVNLVMSPSIDAWAVRVSPGEIRKGDLVRFTLSHPIAGPKPVSVTKYALCMPGDRLTLIETPSPFAPKEQDGHYFCNGVALGTSLPFAADGRRLDHFRWSGVIPAGLAYVGSRHPRGFDSRYLGLLPLARMTRMTRLL